LGERLLCKQEVIGSIPFTSTTDRTMRDASFVSSAAAVAQQPRERLVQNGRGGRAGALLARCGYRGCEGNRWRRPAQQELRRTIG
jgi:hypothetical protein